MWSSVIEFLEIIRYGFSWIRIIKNPEPYHCYVVFVSLQAYHTISILYKWPFSSARCSLISFLLGWTMILITALKGIAATDFAKTFWNPCVPRVNCNLSFIGISFTEFFLIITEGPVFFRWIFLPQSLVLKSSQKLSIYPQGSVWDITIWVLHVCMDKWLLSGSMLMNSTVHPVHKWNVTLWNVSVK